MSSIIACSSVSLTCRGLLSNSDSPSACASRRAGSIVNTTVRRPWCSAARNAIAAAVVVLPTPPEPQHTTIRMRGSPSTASTSNTQSSLAGQHGREPLQAHEVDSVTEQRQLDDGSFKGDKLRAELLFDRPSRQVCLGLLH